MQNIVIHTIEDCLEVLTGLQKHNLSFNLDNRDSSIINSIARQTFKGIALTDKQYALAKTKLLENYKDQFESNGIDQLDQAVEQLRHELRSIDRSKTISVVSHVDMLGPGKIYEAYKEKWQWIKIRFPFNKKTIAKIEKCSAKVSGKKYFHQSGSHEHFFAFDEYCTKTVLDEFANTEFEIQSQILEFYKKIKEVERDPQDNLPCIINGSLYADQEIKDKISKDLDFDFLKIVDRHRRYGLVNFDTKAPSNRLIDQIAYRSEAEFFCDTNLIPTAQIIESLYLLDRFPLLIVIQEGKEEEQLYTIYNLLNGIIPSERQSVLFRLDGESDFNIFVKDKNLNNWVDNATQIVYIRSDKLPKLLLKSDWKPITALVFDTSSRLYRRHLHYYVNEICDLVLVSSDNEYQKKIYKKHYENL